MSVPSRIARDVPAAGPKPILKWAGGKRQLLSEILKHAPPIFGGYYEPFVGGGAVFFALRVMGYIQLGGHFYLGDANSRLMRTYRALQNDVEGVIAGLSILPYDREEFEAMRKIQPESMASDTEVAVWMIYLNRSCFNGLYRVNKAGAFNVPFGRYTNPTICDAEGLRLASGALQGVLLYEGVDFEATVATAKRGDFVYFDPPYIPAGGSSDFTAYTAGGFGMTDQERLRDCARDLKARGVHILLSNADVPAVREIYGHGSFQIHPVSARRNINSKGEKRAAVGEVLIT